MLHAAAAQRPWGLHGHLIPEGSTCPVLPENRTSTRQPRPSPLSGRLVPLGSVCPAPAEAAANAAAPERAWRPGGSVVPAGSTCALLAEPVPTSHAATLDGRLVPMGSRCDVDLGEKPREVLSAPTFSKSFLSANRMPGVSGRATVIWSIVFHTILISAVLLVPMWYTNTMDLRNFTRTLLVAPPPPLAPPAPVLHVQAAQAAPRQTPKRSVFAAQGILLAPRSIPNRVAAISEVPLPPEMPVEGVFGGLPSGLVGGFAETPAPPAPAPVPIREAAAVEQPKQPIRVGGDIRPPHPVHRVEPVYPTLAKQARVQGDVVISAVIDAQGSIVELKVVSGPPLLYQAALNAVRQWKFEPTYLDGEPWPVSHDITVHFRL